MALVRFQAYLQLKDPTKNAHKHYFIAVVQTWPTASGFYLRTAYGRIGRNPKENKATDATKYASLSSARDQAVRVRERKLVKGYVSALIDCPDAAANPPDWWSQGELVSVECSGCGHVIDEEMCRCGMYVSMHVVTENHMAVPMGCTCFVPVKVIRRKNAPWQF